MIIIILIKYFVLDSYSEHVITLFNDLRGKRKLIDILNLLEDMTKCYLKDNDLPASAIINDFDKAVENNALENFSKIEIKKIYKILNKFDRAYTILPSDKSGNIAEKIIRSIKGDEIDTNQWQDDFIVKLRAEIRLKLNQFPYVQIDTIEEYSDEFDAHYIHFHKRNNDKSFAVVVVQNKLVVYHSYVTNRKYPINLKRTKKGIDTLVNVFLEKDIKGLDNK